MTTPIKKIETEAKAIKAHYDERSDMQNRRLKLVAEMIEAGMTHTAMGKLLGIKRPRVSQLVRTVTEN